MLPVKFNILIKTEDSQLCHMAALPGYTLGKQNNVHENGVERTIGYLKILSNTERKLLDAVDLF